MAEMSGFFNAEMKSDGNYDRVYYAQDFASYFAKFIGNGVYVNPATQLQVKQQSTPTMGVTVSIGDAFINGYWYKNDTELNLQLQNANGTNVRVDTIVLRLDLTTRKIRLAVVTGENSSTYIYEKPTRDNLVYELALAHIKVGQAVTEIYDADIKDLRADYEYCGFVKGVVDEIDATNLFKQFDSQFEIWFNGVKDIIAADTEKYDKLFNEWFDSVKDNLNEDAATSLQMQFNRLQEQVERKIYGFESKLTYEDSDGSIVESFLDGRKIVTTENSDGVVTQRYYDTNGYLKYTKKIEENELGHIIETVNNEGIGDVYSSNDGNLYNVNKKVEDIEVINVDLYSVNEKEAEEE